MRSSAGRHAERARLEAACREAVDGSGRLVLVTGEAGIGKSLLVGALADDASRFGLRAVRGWCTDDLGAPTLWPWRRVARDLPAMASALAVADASDDGAPYRLVEAVAGVLADAAGDAGLVAGSAPDRGPGAPAAHGLLVVLEDVHWADSLSLDLLRHLLPEVASLPVLVVATARLDASPDASPDAAVTTPPDRPWPAVLAHLLRAPNAEHVALSGLSEEDVAAWLSSDPATAGWASRAADVVAMTGGNPFYVRSLTSELDPSPGVDVTASLTTRPAWRAVLTAPLRTLPPATRRTVEAASVLGERLSPAVLADALDLPLGQVTEQLAAAVGAGVLHFGDTGLAFTHALVRDAVAAGLGPTQRQQAHRGVAAALERTGDALTVGAAAGHWSRVDGRDAAARCLALASEALTAPALAPEAGRELAGLALRSARTLAIPDDELAERILLLARFEWASGRIDDALASCAEGADVAERAGRPDVVADLALVLQGVGSAEVAGVAGAMARRALALLPSEEEGRRARLLALCAVAQAEAALTTDASAGGASADDLSARALQAGRRSGDPQAELETIAARHLVLSYPQAIDERAVLAARAVELAPTAGTTMGALWGHLWQADLGFQRGEVLVVEAAIAEVSRVAQRLRSPVARWHAERLRGAVELLQGHFDAARAAARSARELAERIGDLSMVAQQVAFHTHLALVRGDPAEQLPGTVEFMAGAPPIPLVRASIALVHVAAGDVEAARAELASVRALPQRMPLGPRWFGTVGLVAHGSVAVGDAGTARTCHRLLLPCEPWCAADGGGSPVAHGSVAYLLGRLAATFGDVPLAVDHLARGVTADDASGARPQAALGRVALAECLAPTDPARARGLLDEVEPELVRLDMPGPLGRAATLRVALPARQGRHTAAPDLGGTALSARELEVARLVGEALTNQQVADRLYLSVRTVESHVRSALAKLGMTTRTELALWVTAQDASSGSARS